MIFLVVGWEDESKKRLEMINLNLAVGDRSNAFSVILTTPAPPTSSDPTTEERDRDVLSVLRNERNTDRSWVFQSFNLSCGLSSMGPPAAPWFSSSHSSCEERRASATRLTARGPHYAATTAPY